MRNTTDKNRPDFNHVNKNYIMRGNWVNNYILPIKPEELRRENSNKK
jgi:hypothetical protein